MGALLWPGTTQEHRGADKDRQQIVNYFDRIIQTFSANYFARRPVFIITEHMQLLRRLLEERGYRGRSDVSGVRPACRVLPAEQLCNRNASERLDGLGHDVAPVALDAKLGPQ